MLQLYENPMESAVTFPAIPDIEYNSDFRVSALHAPFINLGNVALCASHDPEAKWASNEVLLFLKGLTQFCRGTRGIDVAQHSLDPGIHRYEHDLRADPKTGLAAAKQVVVIGGGQHSLSRMVVSYDARDVYGSSEPLVGAVSVSLQIAGHPEMSSYYARLSTDTATGGPADKPLTMYSLRTAVGYSTHDGIPMPEAAGFDQLSAIGEKLAAFPIPNEQ